MQTITIIIGINKLISQNVHVAICLKDRVLITVITDLDLMKGYYHIPHFFTTNNSTQVHDVCNK